MTYWLVGVLLHFGPFLSSSVLERGVGFLGLLFEVEMLCSQVQVLLVALFSSVLLAQVSGTPRRDTLTEMMRADLANDKVSNLNIMLWRFNRLKWGWCHRKQVLSRCLPLGSFLLALAEVYVRADGSKPAWDAPPATGRGRGGGGGSQGGDDAASDSLLPKGTQGRLPQLLLENIYLVLTQDKRCSKWEYFCFQLHFKDNLLSRDH